MLTSQVIGKAGVAGRVLGLAVVAGLLAGGLALPAVGAVGLTVKSGTDKFNNLPAGTLGSLPVRSQLVGAGGHVLAYFYPKGIDREPVSYDQIAPVMRDAIVAIEDSRFYQHGAIDLKGTFRALINDLQHKSVQGGSTLTQQYVKNVLILTAPNTQMAQQATTDTIGRKIKELRLAIEVEKHQTKDEILADYLNVAFFGTFAGNQAVGIQAAAERYFGTTAAKLTLPEAAMLAGMVENPAQYNPITNPQDSLKRRNVVLARMAQLHYITQAHAVAVGDQPLGLHLTPLQTGCTSSLASQAAFFCDYVVAVMQHDQAYAQAWKLLNSTGGLTIDSTLNGQDQAAATSAVNYMLPPPPAPAANPAGNVASEVLIKPGTGQILAIANDRPYGTGPGQTTVDYAVNTQYDGSPDGVQTGSSSKLFTLVTALEQGVPFGFPQTVTTPASVGGYTNCAGDAIQQPYNLVNDSPSEKGAFTLYTATEASVNVYFAMMERKVGLCNVVKTAANLGVTWVDGKSLLQPAMGLSSADNTPSFTLGSVSVSPMSMAAAYATVAARGMYCHPIAIDAIITRTGTHLPVESADCHQAIPAGVADAASYVLQSVLNGPSGTASGLGIGRPAAGKTGTSDNFDYAAFAGYTPDLTGYVSVFYPNGAQSHPMDFPPNDCYRQQGGFITCDGGGMFGADAPAHIWQMTFQHAALAPVPLNFVMSDINPGLWSMGTGQSNPVTRKPGRGGGGGGGGGSGGGPGGGGNGGGPGGGGTGGGPPTH